MSPTPSRIALAGLLTLALVVSAPLAASAHIRVDPGRITAGATNVQLRFSVPTEPQDAPNGETTVLVRVELSKTHPFDSVYVQPVAGWTGKTEVTTLPKPVRVDGKTVADAVTAVVWTADPGKGIPSGSFQNFTISVTPIPDVGRLSMPATQQLSSGAEERWIDPLPRGEGTMPDHPAPTLFVNEEPPTLSGGMAGMSGMGGMTMSESTTEDSGSMLPVILAAGGLVAGLAGLVLGGVAFRRTRRSA